MSYFRFIYQVIRDITNFLWNEYYLHNKILNALSFIWLIYNESDYTVLFLSIANVLSHTRRMKPR